MEETTKRKKLILYFSLVVSMGLVVFLFLMLGPPKLLARSEAPIFCGGCHVMESEFEAWAHAGAHRRKKCVDCHLPNQNMVIHYIWKSIDGMKDVGFFFSGLAPERIRITEHGTRNGNRELPASRWLLSATPSSSYFPITASTGRQAQHALTAICRILLSVQARSPTIA